MDDEKYGGLRVSDALQRWGENIPQTQLLKHVPGYTIIDNLFIFNGSVYLVTDKEHLLPPMSSILASKGPGFRGCTVLSLEKAREVLGSYGSTIRDVSWLSADTKPNNSTLFALWRTYSSLDPSIDSVGRTNLTPPHRLIFPNTPAFTDSKPTSKKEHAKRRSRVDTGFHPYLAKAAFPQLSLQYFEDWNDYQKMEVPFVFERIVIADRSATEGAIVKGQPIYSPPFGLEGGSSHWWEPVRMTLATYLREHEIKPDARKVVTYIHTQESQGAKLSTEDHESITRALEKMGRTYGYEVHVVSSQTSQTDWTTRMTAIVKSSIILSVHGNHLMDSVFMQPSSQSTVIELFPADRFSPDREFAIHARGLKYMAWCGGSQSDTEALLFPPNDEEAISIDSQALVRTIHNLLSWHTT